MQSAFGVDHGEITKGFRAPKQVMGNETVLSGPQKVKRALNRAGEANISIKRIGAGTSRGVERVGGFLERRPGLTGTALVGGGGAAGYQALKPKEKRR